jgi:FKBP-type peptidyl-prolyl cis-trans isomerase SlyD
MVFCLITAWTIPAFGEATEREKEMSVSKGKMVSIEYTLRLIDQTAVDTNVENDPLTYLHGSDQIIPGLQKALEGMKAGQKANITVKPEEAYGLLDKKAFQEVPKEQIPEDALQVDAILQGKDDDGKQFRVRVSEIRENSVLLDFNHPLAGKTLFFDITVLNVQEYKHP